MSEQQRPGGTGEAQVTEPVTGQDTLSSSEQGDDTATQPEKSRKAGKKKAGKKTVGQEILSWVGTLLLAVVIAMTIRALLFEPIRVDGSSMLETLHNNEIVLVTKPAVLFNRLQRGDVIICRFPNRENKTMLRLGAPLDFGFISHELFVKRLVALPGDSVAILNGVLYINDAAVQEDYVVYPTRVDYARRVLGPDEYMVMGDNRANSHDSRYDDVKPLSRSMIVGKAAYVLLPLRNFGPID